MGLLANTSTSSAVNHLIINAADIDTLHSTLYNNCKNIIY